jgi:hypothetical protein
MATNIQKWVGRANSTKVTINEPESLQLKPVRFVLSVFVNSLSVQVYDDFTQPGSPDHFVNLSLAPISCHFMSIPNEKTSLSLSAGHLEARFFDHFQEFPVLIEPIEKGRLLSVNATFLESFNCSNVTTIDVLDIRLRPLRLSVEDTHFQFILSLLPFFGSTGSAAHPPAPRAKLSPIYVRKLHIERTQLLLSVAARTLFHADCQNVEIDLSPIEIRDRECFNISLLSIILDQYMSDIIAGVPLILTSISLIGCPLHIVRQATNSARAAWAAAATGGSSVIVEIGRGSVNLLRGITTGSLESIVRLANDLDATIARLVGERDRHAGRGITRAILELATIPVSALLTLVKETGGLVLRTVGQQQSAQERNEERQEKRILVLFDLDEFVGE